MPDNSSRHDRLAVRLSLIISRLMAGESLSLKALSDEFGVTERTLQRDFHQRLIHLDLENEEGRYRLRAGVGQAFTPEMLSFIRNTGIAQILPVQNSRLMSWLTGDQASFPCLIWFSQLKVTATLPDCFSRLIQAIRQQLFISLLSDGRRHSSLEPYRLIYYGCDWYLVASQKGELRVFLLAEISTVTLTSARFERREDISSLTAEENFISALPHFPFINNLINTFRQ
ncbi:helix-turn-helix transcriptional regulator [Escherichia coli]|uniref:helix-turn-helix transcriptional regulator n=1 Tax=Enterobacteriaceae TaxID=543 RepID=UPI00345C582B